MSLKRKLVFDDQVFEEFLNWANEDRKTFGKIGELLREIQRTPFEGKGKPRTAQRQFERFLVTSDYSGTPVDLRSN